MQINKLQESIKNLEANQITMLEQDYDYLANLNYEQKIAATRQEGNYLVIAGPGSGKTHTLLYRVIHLIKSGTNPQEICVVTFTRKAAEELRSRLDKVLPNAQIGFVGTFHALAHKLLIKNAPHNFRLIDPEDDAEILSLVVKENQITLQKRLNASTLSKIFSLAANKRISIEQALHDLNREESLPDLENIIKIKEIYTNIKKVNKYYNYDDIIESLVFSGPIVNKENQFKYLMIDEYQDTNDLQIEFIKWLKIANVMAIGDDFQSIYSFRGANYKIILNFYNDFPNSQMIVLKQNYRSTKAIVEAINLVVKDAKLGYHKQLNSTRDQGSEVKVVHLEQKNYIDDIAAKISQKPNETHAIIYRTNGTRKPFEAYFIKNNLSYVTYGGVRLLERKHIKDLFAMVLALHNKEDFIASLRALKTIDGIGTIGANKYLKLGKIPTGNGGQRLTEYINILNLSNNNIVKCLQLCVDFYFKNEKNILNSNYTLEEMNEDFQLIIELAKPYQKFENFVNDIILDPAKDYHFKTSDNKTKIILTTIHSAKGLEFDNVFFLNVVNWYSNLYSLETIEEQRRLFYVAISRAKNSLLIYDENNGSVTLQQIINGFKLNTFDEHQNNVSFILESNNIEKNNGNVVISADNNMKFDEKTVQPNKEIINVDAKNAETRKLTSEHSNKLKTMIKKFLNK